MSVSRETPLRATEGGGRGGGEGVRIFTIFSRKKDVVPNFSEFYLKSFYFRYKFKGFPVLKLLVFFFTKKNIQSQ